MNKLRHTKARIDLDALAQNIQGFRRFCQKETLIAGVLKANAYGHDIFYMAKYFDAFGVDYFAVATIEEAFLLRPYFPLKPLLVMGYTPSENFLEAAKLGITLTLFSLSQALLLNEAAKELNAVSKVHIKIDTGFHRLGYTDMAVAEKEIMQIQNLPYVHIEGIFTHLALESEISDLSQLKTFQALLQSLSEKGLHIPIRHALDSIGAVIYPEHHMDMVRIGALFYGYCSRETPFALKPVLSLITQISSVKTLKKGEGVGYDFLFQAPKDMEIATLPIGYGDGLPRNIYQEGFCLVAGAPAKYVGLPCMDQCVIDVTGLSARENQEVLIFGPELSLSHLAAWCGTNKNELLCRISPRVPRLFIQDNQVVETLDYLKMQGGFYGR